MNIGSATSAALVQLSAATGSADAGEDVQMAAQVSVLKQTEQVDANMMLELVGTIGRNVNVLA